jgi:hypothetical protein
MLSAAHNLQASLHQEVSRLQEKSFAYYRRKHVVLQRQIRILPPRQSVAGEQGAPASLYMHEGRSYT